MTCSICPKTFRLKVSNVRCLHDRLAGDNEVETAILWFIQDRYNAKNLLYLRPSRAEKIMEEPQAFIHEVMAAWRRHR